MYDAKCYELAGAFLFDHKDIETERNRDKLAQHIQTTIEEWIEFEEQNTKDTEINGR